MYDNYDEQNISYSNCPVIMLQETQQKISKLLKEAEKEQSSSAKQAESSVTQKGN